MAIYYLTDDPYLFPDSNEANPDGLLAVGGDLSLQRLVAAYSLGIFPWYSHGNPILWWSPDPRCILEPARIHVSRRLKRLIRNGCYRVSMDTAFVRVMHCCAQAPRPQGVGTWIVPDMIRGYTALHEAGLAHSVEVWTPAERDLADGEEEWTLAGGVYGVSLGRAFFGESMFHRAPNASKIALAYLAATLAHWGFDLIDCQQTTDHIVRFGAFEAPRREFNARLAKSLQHPTRRGFWSLPESDALFS